MTLVPMPPSHSIGPGPRLVGLGASAGGLQPLQAFLANVPAGSGRAYIVVQHLDPAHKAMLCELLQRSTSMSVLQANESLRIAPDTVYVIPPNAELTVRAGRIHVTEPDSPRGLRLPIDALFHSLARDQGSRAVGVVLSGMGADGTLGLRAIRAQGGLTLAQSPDSAEFDAMPRSAIAAGCVAVVAPPAELPGRILAAATDGPVVPVPLADTPPTSQDPLQAILALLRARSRHDLSMYKSTTLVRRIERRMTVHRLASMPAYLLHVQANPEELDLLFKEILIGVTAFFRDPAVWLELKRQVLPPLLGERSAQGACLRAWVPGCSTGEEAYSLAIVLRELIDDLPELRGCEVLIFATDLNADAVAAARRGYFPAGIANDVGDERLARFFVPQARGFLIDRRIRDMVLFAQHDVILDPPFTRLDLLSCRNLLIYFNSELQQRLIPLFHYSLRSGGVLLLGGTETVGPVQSLFVPVHPKSRLYRRGNNGPTGTLPFFPARRRPAARASPQEPPMTPAPLPPGNLQSLADQWLLQSFSPPAVLVTAAGDIVHVSGRTGRYLEPAAGKANWNIHDMARPPIRAALVTALRNALQTQKPVVLSGLPLDGDGGELVDITVQPVLDPAPLDGLAMIVFGPAGAAPRRRAKPRPHGATADRAAQDELARAQEEVRALRQQMQASQEELQAANEEMQSTNEELQSANEELTTSKEEAQSMNEELQTINSELQSKLDDLALAQSDMQNLLNSTEIATLFLDNDLNVRRFTEKIARVVHLRDSDIGRPLGELASTLIYPEMHADMNATLRTLATCERDIRSTDGHWFSVRIMPYRTLANVIQGLVITFVDITVAKTLESKLRGD